MSATRLLLFRLAPVLALLAMPCAQGLAGEPSPAERAIDAARAVIARAPSQPDGYTQLALALARRARETSDTAFYDQADAAIARALELAPGNFEARKLRAFVLLGKHEFQQALESATALNREMPDDVLVYGLLTDANVELGKYEEAERACQWMLDLRPGNIPALTRAAYLREIFGDVEGAIELMQKAYERTPPLEVEDRAWMATQLAHLALLAGRVSQADQLAGEALKLFPAYHYALGVLAEVRTSQGRHADAVDLLERRYAAAPHPENLFAVAEARQRAGRSAQARAAFAEFESRALRESSRWDNANRELVFYYTDHARKPAEALRIASLEFSRRRDVHTLDAYAWALHANGESARARTVIQEALAVGTIDPHLKRRAGEILHGGSRGSDLARR